MTSNIGTKAIRDTGGFGFSGDEEVDKYKNLKNTVESALKDLFNPEFLNRVDDTIVFRNLEKLDITKIIKIELKDLIKNLSRNKMEIELDESADEFLTNKGYDPKFGARPLKRAIQNYIEDPLSEELLLGNIKAGDKILVSNPEGKDNLIFNTIKQNENSSNEQDKHEHDVSEKDEK